MKESLSCPNCGSKVEKYVNPFPTVDIIIELKENTDFPKILLIERKNPPYGWAIPGGFVDYGESCESAAIREAKEETGLDVSLTALLGVYSKPDRDPRFHTLTSVYVGKASGKPQAGDDAGNIGLFDPDKLPPNICFDHGHILEQYLDFRNGKRPACLPQQD